MDLLGLDLGFGRWIFIRDFLDDGFGGMIEIYERWFK